jgi:hypothetical protein
MLSFPGFLQNRNLLLIRQSAGRLIEVNAKKDERPNAAGSTGMHLAFRAHF